MKELKRTDNNILYSEEKKQSTYFHREHIESKKKELIYVIQSNKVLYYFPEGESIKKIIIEDVKEIPSFLSPWGFGFNHSNLQSFIKNKLKDDNLNQIKIGPKVKTGHNGKSLLINVEDLQHLISSLNKEQRACNDTKNTLISNFIQEAYPQINFDYKKTNNDKSVVLRNLNDKLIEKLNADEIEQIGKFYVDASRKYKASHLVKRLSAGMMKNAQLITLQEIINDYEKHLKDDPPESTWQTFFDEHITLFDSRYSHKIDYKNIALGSTNYPDLVLVDIYGYLDFYELKKSSTPLITYDGSHKTWYWSPEVSKVIAQVNNYLQKAKENADGYSKAIVKATETDKQKGLEVDIINPRGIIVIGSKKELNTKDKKDQFKSLRESLKDIEFILYDELLDRLKNWFDSIKIK